MAVLKSQAMEWVIEKSVELGVEEVIPVLTAHTVVQIKNKGPELFQERWQKIADQALKQCGRLNQMVIHKPVTFDTILATSCRTSTRSFVGHRFWTDELARGEEPFLLIPCSKKLKKTVPSSGS
jgi:RsmE family RNA methyltransferase